MNADLSQLLYAARVASLADAARALLYQAVESDPNVALLRLVCTLVSPGQMVVDWEFVDTCGLSQAVGSI